MPDLDLDVLRRTLLRTGIAPGHVQRAVAELADHVQDLELEEIARGKAPELARQEALRRIGSTDQLTEQYSSRPDLKRWPLRHRWLGRIVLPVAYPMVQPTAPVSAGIANALVIARWCTCLLLSALVTAGMLLAMQYSITLT